MEAKEVISIFGIVEVELAEYWLDMAISKALWWSQDFVSATVAVSGLQR
ncbi:MAG: hypothetical protein KDD45_13285 [Bdellovibrionales bacterium]|nr:hypothetical protein [Bdellovibrionales bacterium]